MPYVKIQGKEERKRGIYYSVNSDDQPIGAGGMGQVFKGVCVDEKTGSSRPVAIKFMYADLPEHAIERARREAAIQLRNDNLVEMLGFIELVEAMPTGEVRKHYHVVSELLTGVSLSDILEGKTLDRDGQEVPYAVEMLQYYRNDPEFFARIVVKSVLSGLMALHDAGYIHRDIDPSNIMLTTDRHIKLIDFGIAKQMNNLTTNDKGLTVAGAFMGKPEYAAPELALGDVKNQNQTTDIYAVGILLYQCLVGHTPFDGARHEILEKQLKSKIPLGVIKNKALRGIIARACEKKQEQRYQSSAQMRVALETMKPGSTGMELPPLKYIITAIAAILIMIAGVSISKYRTHRIKEVKIAKMVAHIEKTTRNLDSMMKEGEKKMEQGRDSNQDGYEVALMEACNIFNEALHTAQVEAIDEYVDPLIKKKEEAESLLLTAKETLYTQAQEFEALGGMQELADSYRSRADDVKGFLEQGSN